MSAQTAFALFLLIVLAAVALAYFFPKQRGGDAVISAAVIEALAQEFPFAAVQIDVKAFDGVVILGGFVREFDQARRAVELARGVTGVKSVDNRISIRSGH